MLKDSKETEDIEEKESDDVPKVSEVSKESDNQKEVVEEVVATPEPHSKIENTVNKEFRGLSKEELRKYANDPYWVKFRIISYILFWIIGIGMLLAVILIMIFSPGCPYMPKLEFWQKKAGYRLNPYAFKDSNGDGVGDINGLLSKLNYIQKDLGAEYLIIDSIFNGYWTNNDGSKRLDLIEGFRDIDKVLGTEEEFTKLLEECNKLGIEVVLSADFNSLSPSSNLFIKFQDSRVQSKNLKPDWVNREGKPILTNLFYAAVPGKDDLNLNNKEIVQELKDSVNFWLEKGVMGFLLTNVPFYVENTTTGYTEHGEINEINQWFKVKQINSQIFTDSTVDFLKEIRMVINEVAKKTGKRRLLMAEPGQIGFASGPGGDEMLKYLTYNDTTINKLEPLIDVVISREFQPNRGLATDRILHIPSLQLYYKSIPDSLRRRVALTAGSPFANNKAVDDMNTLLELSVPLLLPGSPIIYYGEELGRSNCDKNMSSDIFPKDRLFPLNNLTYQTGLGSCSNMPLIWNSGYKASKWPSRYVENQFIQENKLITLSKSILESESSFFHLFNNLIHLRNKEPSLQWGEMKILFDKILYGINYQIFLRKADGFPTIIIAEIINPNLESSMKLNPVTFEDVCDKLLPILVFPNNPAINFHKVVSSNKIYFQLISRTSLHIFKCQK